MGIELKERKPVKKNKKSRLTWLPTLPSIFICLSLMTTAVVGAHLYEQAALEKYTVDVGQVEALQQLELFSVEYSNDMGEITVKGANSNDVIAPGTSMDYNIRLRNNSATIVDFVMTPKVEFFTDDKIPIQFKIVDDYGNYILGSETEWATPEEMSAMEHKCAIHPSEVFTYHVSWRWLFEGDAAKDSYDTYLGNKDDSDFPGVRVSIGTYAETELPEGDGDYPLPDAPADPSPDKEEDKPEDKKPNDPAPGGQDIEPPPGIDVNINFGDEGSEIIPGAKISIGAHAAVNPASRGYNHIRHLLDKGFGCCWCCWLALLLLFIAIQLLIWIWWLCRKIKKLKKTVEEYKETMRLTGASPKQ